MCNTCVHAALLAVSPYKKSMHTWLKFLASWIESQDELEKRTIENEMTIICRVFHLLKFLTARILLIHVVLFHFL